MTFLELHDCIYNGPRAKLTMGLLCYLLDNADKNGHCLVHRESVFDELEMEFSANSSSNLSHSLKALKEHGIITIVYSRDGVIYEKPGKSIEVTAVLAEKVLKLFKRQ